jgi:hypothetical protein
MLGFAAFLLYRPLSSAVEIAQTTPMAPLGRSKRLVYGMTALFGMDSFGTGFLVQSLLALWLYRAFQVSVTTTATILFWSSVCLAVSYLLAVPIAARIGLINTMVFTHLPSNILLILIPFAPNLATAITLLLARSALSQMDVPTRTSYVMAVVTPPERPAAASITVVQKIFAWAAGSLISGYLLTLSIFGWPLLIGGTVKGVYDILLLIKFQKVLPPEEAAAVGNGSSRRATAGHSDFPSVPTGDRFTRAHAGDGDAGPDSAGACADAAGGGASGCEAPRSDRLVHGRADGGCHACGDARARAVHAGGHDRAPRRGGDRRQPPSAAQRRLGSRTGPRQRGGAQGSRR